MRDIRVAKLTLSKQHKIFWALVCLAVGLMATYLFFVTLTTVNVLSRNHDLKQGALLSEDLIELEQRYLDKNSKITLSLAYEKGFKDINKISYVGVESKDALTAVASFNNEN